MVSAARVHWMITQLRLGRQIRLRINTHVDRTLVHAELLDHYCPTMNNSFAIAILDLLLVQLQSSVVVDHGHKSSSGSSRVSFALTRAPIGNVVAGAVSHRNSDNSNDPGNSNNRPRRGRSPPYDNGCSDPWHSGGADPWSASSMGNAPASKAPRHHTTQDVWSSWTGTLENSAFVSSSVTPDPPTLRGLPSVTYLSSASIAHGCSFRSDAPKVDVHGELPIPPPPPADGDLPCATESTTEASPLELLALVSHHACACTLKTISSCHTRVDQILHVNEVETPSRFMHSDFDKFLAGIPVRAESLDEVDMMRPVVHTKALLSSWVFLTCSCEHSTYCQAADGIKCIEHMDVWDRLVTTCFVLNGLDRVMFFHCTCPYNGISELVIERIASWIVLNLGKRMEVEFSDYDCPPEDIADLHNQVHVLHAWDTYSHNGSVQRIGFPCGCDECDKEYEDSSVDDNTEAL